MIACSGYCCVLCIVVSSAWGGNTPGARLWLYWWCGLQVGGKVFLMGYGVRWVWTGIIAVVGPCVNRSAIICIFVLLSVYSWLLMLFITKKFFLLMDKVGLVCSRVLSWFFVKNFDSVHYLVSVDLVFVLFYFIF